MISQNKKNRNRSSEKEYADYSYFEQQQHYVEFLQAEMHTFAGSEHADGHEERRQDDQEHADAVDAQVIVDWRRDDPFMEFFECVSGVPTGTDQRSRKENTNSIREMTKAVGG